MTKIQALSILESHKADFAVRYGVERIGIFGSVARDEATESSDVDIIAQMPPSFSSLIGLQDELEKEFGTKVDLVRIHDNMRERFKTRILREAIFV
ncbi:MAG: nucleotidyltransferase family protein [Campylobacterales bacterium]